MTEPRRFYLDRNIDVTGASGTGRVADGVVWPDGTVTIRWRGEHQSTVNWDNLASAERVHGHGGATRIMWLDGLDSRLTSVHLMPDDVVLIGNAGTLDEHDLHSSINTLRESLPTAAQVFVFAENIDVQFAKDAGEYESLREELIRVAQHVGAAKAVLALAVNALEHAAKSCRYHGTEFEKTGMRRGLPICDSCKQPYRVKRALDAIAETTKC